MDTAALTAAVAMAAADAIPELPKRSRNDDEEEEEADDDEDGQEALLSFAFLLDAAGFALLFLTLSFSSSSSSSSRLGGRCFGGDLSVEANNVGVTVVADFALL